VIHEKRSGRRLLAWQLAGGERGRTPSAQTKIELRILVLHKIRGSMLVTHPRNAVSHPGYSTRRSNTSTAEATPIPDPGGYSSVTTVAPTCATSRGHPRRANKYARSSSHAVQLHANHGVLCNTIRIRPRCVASAFSLRYTTHRRLQSRVHASNTTG